MINWELKSVDIGRVDFTDGDVVVCDPCYEGEAGVRLKIKPSEYDVSILKDDNMNGAILATAVGTYISESDWEEYEKDTISVDSGQAGIFDWDTFNTDKVVDNFDNLPFEEKNSISKFYPFVSNLTLNTDEGAGCYSKGCISSSGYGDGLYNLYLAKKDGIIIGLMIVFIEDDRVACNYCGKLFNEYDLNDNGYCYSCERYDEEPCSECGNYFQTNELNEDGVCQDCLDRLEEEEEDDE